MWVEIASTQRVDEYSGVSRVMVTLDRRRKDSVARHSALSEHLRTPNYLTQNRFKNVGVIVDLGIWIRSVSAQSIQDFPFQKLRYNCTSINIPKTLTLLSIMSTYTLKLVIFYLLIFVPSADSNLSIRVSRLGTLPQYLFCRSRCHCRSAPSPAWITLPFTFSVHGIDYISPQDFYQELCNLIII